MRPRNVYTVNPIQEARQYCSDGTDKAGLEKRFIDENIGWGVFTTKERTKGEFLLEYAGEVISHKDAVSREASYKEQGLGSFLFFFGKLCIDATEDTGRLGRLVNDGQGEQENCIMRTVKVGGPSPRLCLFARRDIGEGEELRYDYGVDDLPWRQTESQITAAEQTEGKDKEDKLTEVSECPETSNTSETFGSQLHHTCSTLHKADQSELLDASYGKAQPRNVFSVLSITSKAAFHSYFNSCEPSSREGLPSEPSCSQQQASNIKSQDEAVDSDFNLCDSSNEEDMSHNPISSQKVTSTGKRGNKFAFDSDYNPFESSDEEESISPKISTPIQRKRSKKYPSESCESLANLSGSSDDESISEDFFAIQHEELIGQSEDSDIVPPSDCSNDDADGCKS